MSKDMAEKESGIREGMVEFHDNINGQRVSINPTFVTEVAEGVTIDGTRIWTVAGDGERVVSELYDEVMKKLSGFQPGWIAMPEQVRKT